MLRGKFQQELIFGIFMRCWLVLLAAAAVIVQATPLYHAHAKTLYDWERIVPSPAKPNAQLMQLRRLDFSTSNSTIVTLSEQIAYSAGAVIDPVESKLISLVIMADSSFQVVAIALPSGKVNFLPPVVDQPPEWDWQWVSVGWDKARSQATILARNFRSVMDGRMNYTVLAWNPYTAGIKIVSSEPFLVPPLDTTVEGSLDPISNFFDTEANTFYVGYTNYSDEGDILAVDATAGKLLQFRTFLGSAGPRQLAVSY